ncbi:unnamed protein product [Phaedon cochleariae]|uniref:THAP-type domain-containing protein n=1 Tax=Phaedon cochleariae TaxID=80249 RepID=A0A9P0DWI1_PHACE|nr:unnamed protein product [Phaedon cochleariae]
MRCAMAGCNSDNQSNTFHKDMMFFRFPSDINMQKLWVTACRRQENFTVNTARLCSKHFDRKSFKRNLRHDLLNYKAKNLRLLKPHAIPTLNIPKQNTEDALITELDDIQYDGLKNLAGFICHKLKKGGPTASTFTSTSHDSSWVDHLSEGGL